MWKFAGNKWARLDGATGMHSEGPGVAASLEGGFGAVLLSSLIGAFVGVVCGLILSQFLRFLSMTLNRNLGGYSWVIFGAIAGAVVFAFIALNTDKN